MEKEPKKAVIKP